MKFSYLCVFTVLCASCVTGIGADKPAEPQKPIPIYGSQQMGTYDPETRKVTLDKNVDARDVVNVLANELRTVGGQLQACQKEIEKARSSAAKPTTPDMQDLKSLKKKK